jgi:hypothetical protein
MFPNAVLEQQQTWNTILGAMLEGTPGAAEITRLC